MYIYDVYGFITSKVLSGRTFGSCTFLWRHFLKLMPTPLAIDRRKMCALQCTVSAINSLLINACMPYANNNISEDKFRFLPNANDDFIQRFPNQFIICGGDLNVDFSGDRIHNYILKALCKMLIYTRLPITTVVHRLHIKLLFA
jgi:hypothetical protein